MLIKCSFAFVWLFLCLVNCSSSIISNRTDEFIDVVLTHDDADEEPVSSNNKCSVRLHSSLEKLRRRQSPMKSSGLIDLSGYALHQSLRHAPLDMYVTDIKVRTPGVGDWVRVQKCQFSKGDNRITSQILFNDLSVTGNVKLFDENVVLKNPLRPEPSEFCSMTLRLRRAGLGINAFPTRARSKGIEVRTEARFMDPNFLSVHAYGCKLNEVFKRIENSNREEETSDSNRYIETRLQENRFRSNRSLRDNIEEEPEVRIITLGQNFPSEDTGKLMDLHEEHDTESNDYHKDRVLNTRYQGMSEKDKLKAVLHVKNLLAQQANQVFQMHGPFSQTPMPTRKPIFAPNKPPITKPVKPISSITELDENLTPIRPVPHKPFEALFSQTADRVVTSDQSNVDDLSREMEDIFMRGVKTLLTKYLEKQLEIPMKEALMTNIGYTVSYG